MRVSALISQYNMERPNEIPDEYKVALLKKCEHIIITEVINTHEYQNDANRPMEISVTGTTLHIKSGGTLEEHLNSFGMDTELLVKEPYEDLYLYFMDQKIAYNHNDIKRYNVATTMYNNALLTYQQYYNRTHRALRKRVPLINHSRI